MIILILKIASLLGCIILPLRPQKSKLKAKADTKGAHYAVNENGLLEEIKEHDMMN